MTESDFKQKVIRTAAVSGLAVMLLMGFALKAEASGVTSGELLALPEPASLTMLGLGLVGLGVGLRQRQRRRNG